MTASNSRGQPEIPTFKRALRPLLWWLLLFLFLFALRTHERLLERTKISFRTSLDGRPNLSETAALLDGKPFISGERVSLGKHRLTISHPKARTFSTNFFIWYGAHDMGNIGFTRTQGQLAITVHPPALFLSVDGPEWSNLWTNSIGATNVVPTGTYSIVAKFRYWSEKREVVVQDQLGGSLDIAPTLGILDVYSDQPETAFSLKQGDNEIVRGATPMRIQDLPSASYKISFFQRGHSREKSLDLKAGQTNRVMAEFSYGAASFKTTPAGASVVTHEGHLLGTTPLVVSELEPGDYAFSLAASGYETLEISVKIAGNETNVISKTLIPTAFVNAMREASAAMAAESYDKAVAAFTTALQYDEFYPGLRKGLSDARRLRGIQRARSFARNGEFKKGIAEIKEVLADAPGNEEAQKLLTEFERQVEEKRTADDQARKESARRLMETASKRITGAEYFETHKFLSKKRASEVRDAISRALEAPPSFTPMGRDPSPEGQFEMHGEQELMTAFKTSAGKRHYIIVGSQISESETEILFKVVEYRVEAANKVSIGNLIGTPVAVTYHPILATDMQNSEKLKKQVEDGLSDVMKRISSSI